MSQLVLARGTHYRRNIFKRFIPNHFNFGPYFLIGSLVLFVVLVTIITLMFSTRQVTKGYVLNKLDMEHDVLLRESERQEMKISQVKALSYLEQSSKVESMRRPISVVYFGADGNIASR